MNKLLLLLNYFPSLVTWTVVHCGCCGAPPSHTSSYTVSYWVSHFCSLTCTNHRSVFSSRQPITAQYPLCPHRDADWLAAGGGAVLHGHAAALVAALLAPLLAALAPAPITDQYYWASTNQMPVLRPQLTCPPCSSRWRTHRWPLSWRRGWRGPRTRTRRRTLKKYFQMSKNIFIHSLMHAHSLCQAKRCG